jgi:hypothetical protein
VKTLSIEEAKGCFQAVCEEALAGEIIRLQTADGSLLELTPVPAALSPLSGEQLARCYEDNNWAAFENHCGAASH